MENDEYLHPSLEQTPPGQISLSDWIEETIDDLRSFADAWNDPRHWRSKFHHSFWMKERDHCLLTRAEWYSYYSDYVYRKKAK